MILLFEKFTSFWIKIINYIQDSKIPRLKKKIQILKSQKADNLHQSFEILKYEFEF